MSSHAISLRSFAWTALLALSIGGCTAGVTAPSDDLVDARARWTRSAPASYTFIVSRACECLAEMAEPVEVSVRNGVVESRHYKRTGAAVPVSYVANFPTIEQLFAIIDDAVRARIHPMDVVYDPALGYPTRAVIGDTSADGGAAYFVRDVHPR